MTSLKIKHTRFTTRGGRGILLFLLVLCTACAGPKTPAPALPENLNLPRQVELKEVPQYPDANRQGGPSALASVLSWSGLKVDFEALKTQVSTPDREDTLPIDLWVGARRMGRLAYPVNSLPALVEELAAGHPVVVLRQVQGLMGKDWVYAVAVGYDLEKQELYLQSSSLQKVDFHEFEAGWKAWDHWGLLALPPGQFPALVNDVMYLKAALGLEKAGRWQEAAQAFEAATRRWPGNLAAWMGLGNSHYGQNNLARAEAAFRRAAQTAPDDGAPYNNLAHVLLKAGRREEARAAIHHALELGGSQLAVFHATLRAIDAAP